MEVLEWIAKYWVSWLCALIAGGIALFAKHYVKLQKQQMEQKWTDREKNMCGKILCALEEKIGAVEIQARDEDIKIHDELDQVHGDLDTINSGILAIQGKQFKDFCRQLLEKAHHIELDEYEEFEAAYEVYKKLGGNHRGDTLHDRVVDKVQAQMCAENRDFEE